MSKSKGEQLAEDNISAMADMSSEDVFKSLYNNTKETSAVEAKVDTQAEADIAELESELPETVTEEPPVNTSTDKKEIAKEEVKKEDAPEAKKEDAKKENKTEEIDGFELPTDEKKPDAAVAEEVESTWKDLAKTNFGVDIKEDTYEAYNEAVNQTIESKVSTAKELAMADVKKKFEDTIAKTPEAKMFLDLINSNISLEEIIKPTAEIEKLEALSDSELVAKDLELQGWEQNKIDRYIEDRIENGRLDVDAYALRQVLKTNKASITSQRVEAQKEFVQQEQQRVKQALEKDTNQIREAITKRNEFMDTPISDKHKNFVMQKYENGEYHELFKDPNTIAEFLLYKEFGKQGVERLKSKSFDNGKETIAKKLHNVPPKSNAGGKRQEAQQAKSPIGNVEALGDLADYR